MEVQNIDIEARGEKAKALFKQGYNCTQSVFLAYADLLGIDPKIAATLSAPLGGGMGRLREVCGAASGMFLLAGFIEPHNDPTNKETKTRTYTLVQELAEAYKQQNGRGSIVCRDLLGLDHKKDEPTPSDRTAEYYKKRPCGDLIALAARIVGQKIQERGIKHKDEL